MQIKEGLARLRLQGLPLVLPAKLGIRAGARREAEILSSAVFITNIAEYDFRYTQDVVWRLERLGAASDSSS